MDNRFTFKRGAWDDGSPLAEWKDGQDSDQYLQSVGYSRCTNFGNDFGSEIEVFESKDGSFVALVTPLGSYVYEVYIPDFPSLMMFMRDYVPAFATEVATVQQHEMLGIMQKLFYLQHGHAAHRICPQCAPEEWEDRERRLKTNS